jgi:aminoglycoside 3-N-acetyltransferase I
VERLHAKSVGAIVAGVPQHDGGSLRRQQCARRGGLTAHTLRLTRAEVSEVFIYDLAVVPRRQRRGVGRALVAALRTEAARAGITVAFVPADNDDTHALDFYHAIGGIPAPVTMFTFGEEAT